MAYLEYALWFYFCAYPIYIFLTYETEAEAVLKDPSLRMQVYRSTAFYLWLPTVILLILTGTAHIPFEAIGISWRWDLNNQIAWGLLLLIAIYFYRALSNPTNPDEIKQFLEQQTDSLRCIMPSNKQELRFFTSVVCVSAGVCEELLFRGYLLYLFDDKMPIWAGVILSSIAFGLPHIYQGFQGVIRTALLGAVFALIYLVTDSLLIPILLHILVDVYGGHLMFKVTERTSPQSEKWA